MESFIPLKSTVSETLTSNGKFSILKAKYATMCGRQFKLHSESVCFEQKILGVLTL